MGPLTPQRLVSRPPPFPARHVDTYPTSTSSSQTSPRSPPCNVTENHIHLSRRRRSLLTRRTTSDRSGFARRTSSIKLIHSDAVDCQLSLHERRHFPPSPPTPETIGAPPTPSTRAPCFLLSTPTRCFPPYPTMALENSPEVHDIENRVRAII